MPRTSGGCAAASGGATLPRHVGVMLDGNRRWARARGRRHQGGAPGRRRQHRQLPRLVRGRRRRGRHPLAAVDRQPQPPRRRARPPADDHRDRRHRPRRDPSVAPQPGGRAGPAARRHRAPAQGERRRHRATSTACSSTSPSATAAAGRSPTRCARCSQAHAANGTSIEELAESLEVEHIAEHLYTKGQPDPDLVIRTSGEQRLVGLPALAERAQRVLLLRGVLARLPPRRLPAGPARLRRAQPPLRLLSPGSVAGRSAERLTSGRSPADTRRHCRRGAVTGRTVGSDAEHPHRVREAITWSESSSGRRAGTGPTAVGRPGPGTSFASRRTAPTRALCQGVRWPRHRARTVSPAVPPLRPARAANPPRPAGAPHRHTARSSSTPRCCCPTRARCCASPSTRWCCPSSWSPSSRPSATTPSSGYFARRRCGCSTTCGSARAGSTRRSPSGTVGGTLRVELNHTDPSSLPAGFRLGDNDTPHPRGRQEPGQRGPRRHHREQGPADAGQGLGSGP